MNLNDLKALRKELDKDNYRPSIIHYDGKNYSSSKFNFG